MPRSSSDDRDPPVRARPLGSRHTDWLRRALLSDPAQHCYLLALLEARGTAAIAGPSGTLYGVFDRGDEEPRAAYWLGGSIVGVHATPQTNEPIVRLLNTRGRWTSSITGDAAWVLDLARSLAWGRPRGVRPEQPLLVFERRPSVPLHPGLRVARPADFPWVYPASVEMFTEEVGFSPIADGDRDYRARVQSLLESGSTLVITTDRTADGRPVRRWPAVGGTQQVVFKADLGIRTTACVQIQGVWTHPDFRGQGIASAAMAAVSAHTQHVHSPVVSLYANSYNAPALRVYEKAGYVQRGTFATVMY